GSWGNKDYWYTIVGVVKEIRERGVAEKLKPAIYRVHEQADQSVDQPSGIVVRTSVDPTSIIAAVRRVIAICRLGFRNVVGPYAEGPSRLQAKSLFVGHCRSLSF